MIVVLIGPSGSGKTEFSKECIKQGLDRVITNTTRARRDSDRPDEYYFLTETEFLNKIKNNELVEYALYNGNYYGVSKSAVTPNCVVTLEPNGFKKLKELYNSDIFSVYFEVSEAERARRVKDRGDGLKSISERIIEDRTLFNDCLKKEVNLVLTDIKLDKIPYIVKKYISIWKG